MIEARWHNANHGDGFTVEPQRTSDNIRGAGKPVAPEIMTENNDLISAWLVFFCGEDSSQ